MAATFDVCIRGAGIVGRTLALLLARERLRVALVDPGPSEAASAAGPDVRTYALNNASRELLTSLRCWVEEPASTTVLHMQVQGDDGGQIQFTAEAAGVSALAWIVDAAALEQTLAQAVRFQPGVEVLASPCAAPLTVICEGRASQTRAELGVEFDVSPYAQHALATRISASQAHQQTARQWFQGSSILALLPSGGAASCQYGVVWSLPPERAAQLEAAEPGVFCEALQAAAAGSVSGLQLEGERKLWPLQKAYARRWTGQTASGAWALAGDAAHTLHPLAGQGLNLGLADVQTLARVLRERAYWRPLADPRLLRQYERSRKAQMAALAAGVDGLQLLFMHEHPALKTLRNRGLSWVDGWSALKHRLAREAMQF